MPEELRFRDFDSHDDLRPDFGQLSFFDRLICFDGRVVVDVVPLSRMAPNASRKSQCLY